jgi:hypothetical protein
VEGLAVALDRSASDELTPHAWAAAAHRLRVAPALAELLGPRFLAQNQALAYTLAGSFLGFVHDRYGSAALRRVYRSGDYARALGKNLDQLEAEWRAFLAERPVSPAALALAEQRFERPGVLSQVCPHDVEAAEAALAAASQSRDLPEVVARAEHVLSIDRTAHGARIAKIAALSLGGEPAQAESEVNTLAGLLHAPQSTVARARMALADGLLARGDRGAAAAVYGALLSSPDSDAELRQREVRLLAATLAPPAGGVLANVLVGRPGEPPEPRATMHAIAELASLRSDGLAPYLEARQLLLSGRADLADGLIVAALRAGLPSPRLRQEALRMRIGTAYVLGDLDGALRAAEGLRGIDGDSSAAREAADYAARVAFRRGH